MQVCEVQADCSRLEYVAGVELHNGHPPERLARTVLLAAPLLPVHDGQLVWLADLLEHPQRPPRSPGVLAVNDVQHRADDNRYRALRLRRPSSSPRLA